jgi:hypothetical protein
MALTELGPLIDRIAGSINGTTFGHCQAGLQTRGRAGPPNASTETQLAARNTFDYLAKQWQLLSKTEQGLWDAAGQIHPLPNRLGRYRPIAGFTLWMQLGTNLVNAGQALNNTPPAEWTTPPVQNPVVTATLTPNATTSLTASWNQQTMIDSVIVLKATPPTKWGRTPQRHQLRTIANLAPDTVPPIQVITAWSAVYGLPPQGTPYQILWQFMPYQRSTGVQGPWIDFIQSTGGPDPSPPPAPGSSASAAPTIAESLTNRYVGSTSAPEWLALETAANLSYTIAWTSANITGAPTIYGGPSPTSLTALYTLAESDAFTFTARSTWTYYVGIEPWATTTDWSILYAPSQVQTFPFAHLTGRNRPTWLLAETTNLRLVSDIEYQGP